MKGTFPAVFFSVLLWDIPVGHPESTATQSLTEGLFLGWWLLPGSSPSTQELVSALSVFLPECFLGVM